MPDLKDKLKRGHLNLDAKTYPVKYARNVMLLRMWQEAVVNNLFPEHDEDLEEGTNLHKCHVVVPL